MSVDNPKTDHAHALIQLFRVVPHAYLY